MPDKEIMQYLKDFFDTLAGKLTAILAFALLVVIVLGAVGASIPVEYRWLVYIVVILAMIIFAGQAIITVAEKHNKPDVEIKPKEENSPKEGEETPKESTLPVQSVSPEEAKERYLRFVIRNCSNMRLVGIDPGASDPNRGGMSLENLYISLDTRTMKDMSPGKEKEPLSAVGAWAGSEKRRMVLLGLPGTGKSTFIRYLSLCMAKAIISVEGKLPDGWFERPLFPFMISLGRFAETLPHGIATGTAELIEEYLVRSLKNEDCTKEFSSIVLETIKTDGALIMFDGLDEVADIETRPLVVQAIEDFYQKYQRNHSVYFLVTCRTFSYRNDAEWKLTGWETHELALLSRKKVNDFVNAWYTELGVIEQARKDEYAEKQVRLLENLQPGDRRRLSDIAAFPLILTIMAVVHTHYGDLPDTRAEVYERCVDLLLIRWQGERSVEGKTRKQSILDALQVSKTVLYQGLWEVAYKAHGDPERDARKGDQTALVTEDLLVGVLKVFLKESKKVDTFLNYCQSANGLLMLQGTLSAPGKPSRNVYTFPHLTFEEYLAARHLADHDPIEYAYDLVAKTDRWHESVKLLGEHLCFGSPQRPMMSALLDALADTSQTKNEEEKARMIWLAGELLLLYQGAFPSKQATSCESIFAQLKQLAVTAIPDPRIRAQCASLADDLGYIPQDIHTFIPIPTKDAPDFWMARYPVTNGQYARFLDAEDFAAEQYWVDFPVFAEAEKAYQGMGNWGRKGYKWLQENLDERNKVLPRYWTDPRFGAARRNAPVVGVSWYEANAYCKWLTAHAEQPAWEALKAAGLEPGGVQMRLPTEREWVQAAGGEGNDRFPWGGLSDAGKEIVRFANTDESGIGCTTPVWMYPQGESQPHGVMDMSGNVFEWQANYYDKDHKFLSWRGGSWDVTHQVARVANRLFYFPLVGDNLLGFRVVAVSPPH